MVIILLTFQTGKISVSAWLILVSAFCDYAELGLGKRLKVVAV
jgi:hypothetical protein